MNKEIRDNILLKGIGEDLWLIHHVQDHTWQHKQREESMMCLHEKLGALIQEAQQGILDAENTLLADDRILTSN